MATLIYRCPVSPDTCPTSTRSGFCERHTMASLEPVHPDLAAPPEEPPPPQPEAPRQVALRVLGEAISVPPEGLMIGRDAPRFTALPGMADLLQGSRLHARVDWRNGALYVTDLDSVNGTYVDGERVREARELRAGQMLRLGLDVELPVVDVELDEYGLPR